MANESDSAAAQTPVDSPVPPLASDPPAPQPPAASTPSPYGAAPAVELLSSADQAALSREREALVRGVSFDPKTPWEANQVARYLSASTLLPEGMRYVGRWKERTALTQQQIIHNIVALIMWGRQWNLPVWASINVHIIDGKPTLPAAMMVAIVQESPLCHYLDFVEEGDGFATWETVKVRKDGTLSTPLRMTFTREQAQKLGYYDKGRNAEAAERNQWNTQEGVMLQWRAATRLIRVHYPALIHGLHSTEEMIDAIDIGPVDVEVLRTARADVDKARNGNPLVIGPPKSDNAIPDPQPAQPEPAARQTVKDRVRDKAQTARRGRDAPPDDLFAPSGETACDRCGGPIPAAEGPTCTPCRNG